MDERPPQIEYADRLTRRGVKVLRVDAPGYPPGVRIIVPQRGIAGWLDRQPRAAAYLVIALLYVLQLPLALLVQDMKVIRLGPRFDVSLAGGVLRISELVNETRNRYEWAWEEVSGFRPNRFASCFIHVRVPKVIQVEISVDDPPDDDLVDFIVTTIHESAAEQAAARSG